MLSEFVFFRIFGVFVVAEGWRLWLDLHMCTSLGAFSVSCVPWFTGRALGLAFGIEGLGVSASKPEAYPMQEDATICLGAPETLNRSPWLLNPKPLNPRPQTLNC